MAVVPLSKITPMAMGWPSPGAITHCLVLPFGSSSPPFFEPCQVIDFDRANGKYFR